MYWNAGTCVIEGMLPLAVFVMLCDLGSGANAMRAAVSKPGCMVKFLLFDLNWKATEASQE
jgi:hypothetical protein